MLDVNEEPTAAIALRDGRRVDANRLSELFDGDASGAFASAFCL